MEETTKEYNYSMNLKSKLYLKITMCLYEERSQTSLYRGINLKENKH
jgi:hypothetical protein